MGVAGWGGFRVVVRSHSRRRQQVSNEVVSIANTNRLIQKTVVYKKKEKDSATTY